MDYAWEAVVSASRDGTNDVDWTLLGRFIISCRRDYCLKIAMTF
ncbi:MAG: hypothetical protein ACUVTC_00760 [Candidatus Bathycorpusculaceae bacterium]